MPLSVEDQKMKLILNISFLLSVFLLCLKDQLIWAQDRIVGGDEIEIEKVPYMLRLVIPRKNSNKASFCGAGIISKEWAVTAAHCFLNPNGDDKAIHVIAGTADLENRARTARKYKVEKYIIHEHYKGVDSDQKIEADIALLKLSPPISYNRATKPVQLPEKGEKIERSHALIAGWGLTQPGGKGATKLRYVVLPRVRTSTCKQEYNRRHLRFHEGEICYGFHNATVTKDTCKGDSGGPLVNDDNIVLGVVSKGVRCDSTGLPGTYTDTLFFRDWIRNKTGI